MSYDYLMLAVAILVPLGLFSLLRSEKGLPSPALEGSTKVPGGFGASTSSKSKKKKNKKKNAAAATGTAASVAGGSKDNDDDGESDEDDQAHGKTSNTISRKKHEGNMAKTPATARDQEKAAVDAKEAKKTGSTVSSSTATIAATSSGNKKKGKKSQFVPVESVAELERRAAEATAATTQRMTPDQLRFSAAAASVASDPASSASSSQVGVSIPGPGAASSKGRKKGGSSHGSGLSHADFPTLDAAAKKKPEVAYAPKQPKALHHDMLPSHAQTATAARIDQSDSEDGSDEEQEVDQPVKASENQDGDEEEDEWQTVTKGSAPAASAPATIDFNKPMDPWVLQQQRERLARIQEADPHGENTIKVARVLSIKPTVKDERYREPVPEGFQTQKSRSLAGSGSGHSGSSSSSNEPLTKKQRENLARAARKKEEKAAMDALQEQRRREHLRNVEAERMKEFYRNQNRSRTAAAQAAPSKWNQGQQKATSTVSGGMSAQFNDKGQLVWD